jgi:hypothetical protein
VRSVPKQTNIPHSWSIDNWPPSVFPSTVSKGRYLIRVHRDELLIAGALSRVGRDLIVIGERYARWLEKKAARVPGFEIPPNRPRQQQPDANP